VKFPDPCLFGLLGVGHEVMGQTHLIAVGGAGVTDADGFCGATLRFCHINVLLPRVVCRGQPKNATAGVKALKYGFRFPVFSFRLKKLGHGTLSSHILVGVFSMAFMPMW